MNLTSKSALQIQKPIKEVFDAIIDSKHLTKYFISESSGNIETGKKLTWKFEEFPEEFTVEIKEVCPYETISFVWDGDSVVKIQLKEQANKSTVVHITEGEREVNEENLKWLVNNTSGWANFLNCLKAYLEYGINLRKGAFEFLRTN